ncbi:cupin domain-containing protein [Pseudaestuariivita sp.]|uniref:cupin domain-containing protein n=1 Tax=Pseudaestuariivita sp. TaxID=2211669 RepID=UPI004058B1ED
MTPAELDARIVRYGDLIPCKTAFIDAHTPGSDQKENFTIIGGGVSESADQHVHIKDTPGFNIGAAGQPPKCRNSLHSHRTAEVFFVLKGRWRFFWGRHGKAGEVVLEEGDIFNIPTGIFRGFENIGTDYGMIMAILGGDDAGGGVLWAPEVITDAKDHGLVLAETGKLYDTKRGQALPDGVSPMPLLGDDILARMPEPSAGEVVPTYVARYWDMMALSSDKPAPVIGAEAMLVDKPGFEVDFISHRTPGEGLQTLDCHHILMPMRGHWKITMDGQDRVLNPGDTCAVPPGVPHDMTPSMSGEASMFRVRNTDDPAGPTWVG